MEKRLGRPRRNRKIGFKHKANFFKPQGRPLSDLKLIEITKEELEALRLKDLVGLDQRKCAEKMDISPSTFQRLVSTARKKVSQALIEGQAILIKEI